jgi:hypothetical protein
VPHARRAAVALVLALGLPPVASAAQPPAAPAPAAPASTAVDAEEAFDDALKSFGYLTGLARGCVVPAQRTKIEREAVDLSGAIGRLFGTDRSFLFASSFGYGTSIVAKVEDCPEILKQYDARVAKFRAGRGATP